MSVESADALSAAQKARLRLMLRACSCLARVAPASLSAAPLCARNISCSVCSEGRNGLMVSPSWCGWPASSSSSELSSGHVLASV
eukprot:5693851-Karenia_brevis.AAC.1